MPLFLNLLSPSPQSAKAGPQNQHKQLVLERLSDLEFNPRQCSRLEDEDEEGRIAREERHLPLRKQHLDFGTYAFSFQGQVGMIGFGRSCYT